MLSVQDNPNPVALSLDEILKQNETRTKRTKKKSLWISEWAYSLRSIAQLVPQPEILKISCTTFSSPKLVPGMTKMSELDNTDRDEFDSEVNFFLMIFQMDVLLLQFVLCILCFILSLCSGNIRVNSEFNRPRAPAYIRTAVCRFTRVDFC